MSAVTLKEELHRLVEVLSQADAQEALDYLKWLLERSEELTEQELMRVRAGKEQIERGE